MYPEIFQLGPLHLRSYGLMLSLSFVLGLWLALREARARHLNADSVVDLAIVVLVGGVAGGRLLYVVGHLNEFQGRWHEVLYVWQGGLTLWGGFLVAVPAGILFCVRRGLPTWAMADVLAGPVAMGAAVGRFGCFLNGCCYGLPTRLPWGVRFPAGSLPYAQFGDDLLQPSQLYNVLAGLVTYVVVVAAGPHLRAPGQRWWLMLGLYALLRGVVDLSRYYEPAAFLAHWGGVGITESQVVGGAMAILSLVLFLVLGRRVKEETGAAEPAAPADPARAAGLR